MSNRTVRELDEIVATVHDARECLKQTMQVGFQRVEEYGQLTIALVAGTQPPPYGDVVDRQQLASVFSALVDRGIAQGHFRADVDVEYAVAVWFALVAPQALSQLMKKRSIDEIAAATTDFMLNGLANRPSAVEA